MNIPEEDLDRIHMYLMDEMSPAAKEAFEQECAQNAALAEALSLERRVVAVIQQDSIQKIREAVQRAAARDRRRKRTRVIMFIPLAAAAAGMALLLYFNFSQRQDWYALPPRDLLTDTYKGRSSEDSIMKIALGQFDRQAYDSAIAALQAYPDSAQGAARAYFLRGHCHYAMDAAPLAAAEFKSARDRAPADSKLRRYAWWYLVLAYLKQGNEELARTELKNLHDTEGPAMDDALRAQVEGLTKALQ